MRTLALETSGMSGSVAALDQTQVLAEIELDPKQRTARTLTPAIQQLLHNVGWTPPDIELIAVTAGPGSFTGLRIGVTTAKTLAYATGAKLVGVNTLAVIANQIPACSQLLWVVMNAERDQLFAGAFRHDNGRWKETKPTRIINNDEWLASLTDESIVTGPGLIRWGDKLPSGLHAADASLWFPRARTVALEGQWAWEQGVRSEWWSLLPNYFRESAATEKARGQS